MKKISLMLLCFTVISIGSFAQGNKAKFVKVNKDVRKEGKKLEKDGWQIIPGDLPLNQQLNATYEKQMAEDENGMPKWIVGTAVAKGGTQSAAEMQALELAKLNLLSIMEANMKSVVETDLSNNQISDKEALSISKTIQVATSRASKKLAYMKPTLKIARKSSKLYEVRTSVAYNFEIVRKMILEEAKEELKTETADVRKKNEEYLSESKLKGGKISNASEEPAEK